jgi:SAM-dependent methyltransferase
MMNYYLDEEHMRREVAAGHHRQVVGGLWEELGALQARFLQEQGLTKGDRLLDIGCGTLRGGVHLIPLLGANYYGLDASQALLDAGYEQEAALLDVAFPRSNLHRTTSFEIPWPITFDFGLAQSLFTHLPVSELQRCLETITPHFRSGARLFATCWEGAGPCVIQSCGKPTFEAQDPYHYTQDVIATHTPADWSFRWIGDWGHLRGQQMMVFTRR